MHPDLGEPVAAACGLGDFVFVVRELQIVAAAMDIEFIAQQIIGHCGTFDVPSGAPTAPWAIPSGLIIGGGFPEDEIHWILFEWCDFDAGACDHVIHRAARQSAVVFVRSHTKQRVTFGGIGMALFDQTFDHFDHFGDVFGGAGGGSWFHGADCGHVIEIPSNGFIGTFGDQFLEGACGAVLLSRKGRCVDFVINVGEVTHIGDLLGPVGVAQQAEQRIKHNHRARVAKVRAVINRRAADVHAHVVGVDWFEVDLVADLCIVEFDCHVVSPNYCPLGRTEYLPKTSLWGLASSGIR